MPAESDEIKLHLLNNAGSQTAQNIVLTYFGFCGSGCAASSVAPTLYTWNAAVPTTVSSQTLKVTANEGGGTITGLALTIGPN